MKKNFYQIYIRYNADQKEKFQLKLYIMKLHAKIKLKNLKILKFHKRFNNQKVIIINMKFLELLDFDKK